MTGRNLKGIKERRGSRGDDFPEITYKLTEVQFVSYPSVSQNAR